jgi:hypothetical protein
MIENNMKDVGVCIDVESQNEWRFRTRVAELK